MKNEDVCTLLYKNNPFDPERALNIYAYGSRVYGTNDEKSDTDLILVVDMEDDIVQFDIKGVVSCTAFSKNRFVDLAWECDISVLECIFLQDKFRYKETFKPALFTNDFLFRTRVVGDVFRFKIDLPTLRKQISHKASHSFVKAKKKFEVEGDYNIGKKSLFHALRIIMFGTQLAIHRGIFDYGCANYLWEAIKNDESEEWRHYKEVYKPVFNGLMTSFRKIAPKK